METARNLDIGSEASKVNLLIYLDANYAAPATVMVRSVLENSMSHLNLFVLAIDLSDEIKRTMVRSWPADRVTVHWLDVDLDQYAKSFAQVNYLSRAAYTRLLIDRYLPTQIERVITLDCDAVMLGDVAELWNFSHENYCVMAVRDPCVPNLSHDSSSFLRSGDQDAPYFNSGLMLVNLKLWREKKISERCIKLAEQHPGRALYADQSLLNSVFQGEWEPLPLSWNCNFRHLLIHSYPSLRDQVYSHEEVIGALSEPKFVHFLSRSKPWHDRKKFHPHRKLYDHFLGLTLWASHERRSWLSDIFGRMSKNSFRLRCYRQANQIRKKLRVSARRVADMKHFCTHSGDFTFGDLL